MVPRWHLAFLVILAAVSSAPRTTRAIQGEEKQPNAQAPPAQPTPQLIVQGKILGEEVPPRAGEICVVCGRPIGTEGVVYLVNGQRVPTHVSDCYVKFRRNPPAYLAALQPHGAFLGAGGEAQNLSWGWFFAGLYVLAGLVFGALCAHRALSAGRRPSRWFAAGLALNVVGYLWLLARPTLAAQAAGVPQGLGKLRVTFAPQPCPQCGRLNHPSADRCADCGGELKPAVSSEVGKAGLRSS